MTHLVRQQTKTVLIGYLLIGLVFAIYGNFWGNESYEGIFYHLGHGLIWPITILVFLWHLLLDMLLYLLYTAVFIGLFAFCFTPLLAVNRIIGISA